jgi:hypothetical protein
MAWETRRGGRRYYYRSVRRGGRVEKEYLGGAPWVDAAARLEEMDRERREWERFEQRAEEERLAAATAPLAEFCAAVELLARVELLAAGYHRHDRGAWRRRRGETNAER